MHLTCPPTRPQLLENAQCVWTFVNLHVTAPERLHEHLGHVVVLGTSYVVNQLPHEEVRVLGGGIYSERFRWLRESKQHIPLYETVTRSCWNDGEMAYQHAIAATNNSFCIPSRSTHFLNCSDRKPTKSSRPQLWTAPTKWKLAPDALMPRSSTTCPMW